MGLSALARLPVMAFAALNPSYEIRILYETLRRRLK